MWTFCQTFGALSVLKIFLISEITERTPRPYSICRIWIQIHSEYGFGFTGK